MSDYRFGGDVTFDEVVRASGVEMDKKGLYFAKPFRTCEYLAAFIGAARAMLSAKDREIQRLLGENAKLADRHSREAAKTAVLAEEKAELTKACIKRGLESLPDVTPTQRDRVLNISAG